MVVSRFMQQKVKSKSVTGEPQQEHPELGTDQQDSSSKPLMGAKQGPPRAEGEGGLYLMARVPDQGQVEQVELPNGKKRRKALALASH